MNIKKIFSKYKEANFCFYCGVDSDELKTFLIVLIGGLVTASVFIAIGLWLKGYFTNIEDSKIKDKVLEIER